MAFRHALPQAGSSGAVAPQAQGTHVGEIAFTAAFHYGENVIGIPQVAAHAPLFFKLPPRYIVELALILAQSFGIEAALRADTAIAGEHLLPHVAGSDRSRHSCTHRGEQNVRRRGGIAVPHQRQ